MKLDNRKCKYDTEAPPINKDSQTKCVTCDENDADNPEAYEACLKYPVESVNPTTICESTAGCTLVETEIEERKWENGNEDFVKSTKAVQRVCKDAVPVDDMNRIKIREEVSQCRGDLCNKRRFEVDPVCLPSITTASATTDEISTDVHTSAHSSKKLEIFACACVRVRIFLKFRVRVRARAHLFKILSARACACASPKNFRVRVRARAHDSKFSRARARTCAHVRIRAHIFLFF
jgi:hypothetical protein